MSKRSDSRRLGAPASAVEAERPRERLDIAYWLIRQFPGATGNLMRARYLGRRMKRVGRRLIVMAGSRFRAIENLEVGDNVSIGFDNFLDAEAGLSLGDHVLLAPGVKIWTGEAPFDDSDTPAGIEECPHAPVVLEDDVFIGSNALILPGAVLPRGCVVSAGAVVVGNVYRPYSMLGGNPARVIGYRGGMTPKVQAGGAIAAALRTWPQT